MPIERQGGRYVVRKKKKKPKVIPFLILFLLTAIYSGGCAYYTFRFFPGTVVNGMEAGNKSIAQIQSDLDGTLESYVLIINGKETVDEITAEDIGLSYSYAENGTDVLQKYMDLQNAFAWPVVLITGQDDTEYSLSVTYDEDKLEKTVSALNCVSPETVVKPKDAYYTYEYGQYVIVPEEEGNQAKKKKVLKAVQEAVTNLETSISVDGLYKTASITSEDKSLNAIVDAANLILSSEITVETWHHSVTLDTDTVNSFLSFEDNTVDIDEDAVYNWVYENITEPNNTVGIERTVKTPANGKFTVSGGTYGMQVDSWEETWQIISELKEGTSVTREPNYSQSEKSESNSGVGETYIEVDIDDQMVYLVEDGEITYRTECVTGLTNGVRDTPVGIYYVSWKTTNWTMKKYDTFVYYWMPIDDSTGVGLHDATWRSSFGGSIYTYNGSHGCINLPYEAAKYLYNNTEVGIPVIVH